MKKFLLFLFMLCSTVTVSAGDYYSAGSNAGFYAYTFDGQYFLILSFKEGNTNKLASNTIVKFLLNDGSVLRLEGSQSDAKDESSYVHYDWNSASGTSSETHYATLEITKDEIEKLKIGVSKVAINTLPEVYKRSKWSGRDKFGMALYTSFKNLKGEFEE